MHSQQEMQELLDNWYGKEGYEDADERSVYNEGSEGVPRTWNEQGQNGHTGTNVGKNIGTPPVNPDDGVPPRPQSWISEEI